MVTAIALGALLGLVAGLVYYRQTSASPTPALTPELFDQARSHWAEESIDNYDVEIQVTGLQAATYFVEVRRGIARKALRNGQPLRQQRTLGTWSVNGMFSTIASDVERLRHPKKEHAQANALHLKLRAEFDPQWGFPRRYYRLEQVRFGNNRSVSWRVTRFQPVGEADPGQANDSVGDGNAANDRPKDFSGLSTPLLPTPLASRWEIATL